MIVEITRILNSISGRWACILSNGRIVHSRLDVQDLGKMVRILRAVINEMEVGNVLLVRDLIVFRLSFKFFIFILGDVPREQIKKVFLTISSTYAAQIESKFEEKAKVEKIPINVILFSMALGEGPEPIVSLPDDYDTTLQFKVGMKSLLLLSVESQGATQDMISFQPFMDLNSLGIVFLFQIEDPLARGGAYDSSITVLVDYKHRAVMYEHYKIIEKSLTQASRKILREYDLERNYKGILEELRDKLSEITFEKIESEDIKEEMKEQIQKLVKL